MKNFILLSIVTIGLMTSTMSACSGVPSAGGSGGSSAGGSVAQPAQGNTIQIDNAWVDQSGNTVGIQGAFFILEDGVKEGATLTDSLPHSDFHADVDAVEENGVSKFGASSTVCVSGTAARVMAADGTSECGFQPGDAECNFDSTWGGGIGLNLNETGGDVSEKSVFDAVAAGITGFRFKVGGDSGGADVRFKVVPKDSTIDYCKTITTSVPGDVEVRLADVLTECWNPNGVPADLTMLESLQWQIVTDNTASHDVKSFCVESLEWF